MQYDGKIPCLCHFDRLNSVTKAAVDIQLQVIGKQHIQSLTAKYRKTRISLGLDLYSELGQCDFCLEDISVFWFLVLS